MPTSCAADRAHNPPTIRPTPEAPTIRPKPKLPVSYSVRARKISATLMPPIPICAIVHAIEDGRQLAGSQHGVEPLANVLPVATADRALALQQTRRDSRHEHSRDPEGDGVHPVRERRARQRDDRTAGQRPDDSRPPVDELQERVRDREIFVADEVRHTREHGRAEERVADPCNKRERDDRLRAVDERQRGEHGQATEIRSDHQALAREAIDERAEEEPDRDRRHDVRRQQSAHPPARVRAVVDLDLQREQRQPGSDSRT